MRKIELLSPAGSIEKLKYAIAYGADAVYIGADAFSLRAGANNLSPNDLKMCCDYVHSKNKKIYLATNIVARNEDVSLFKKFYKEIENSGVDALIITDLGLFSLIREIAPKLEIHISTQANSLNYESCNFLHKMGAKRIVLARELSLTEIKEIRDNTPKSLELEAFVHGAMCMAYSGRCLLSDYITDRSSNKGKCSQPCRFNYALVEEKRLGDYMPVYEDEGGTFILNSKDLCMIEYVNELYNAGIDSFKIEGRVKSEFYVAITTRAYRRAINDFVDGKPFDSDNLSEVLMASHRTYTTGFYLNEQNRQIYGKSSYEQDSILIGNFLGYENGLLKLQMKNKFSKNDVLEIINPNNENISFKATTLLNEEMQDVDSAIHPMSIYHVNAPCIDYSKYTLIRKRV